MRAELIELFCDLAARAGSAEEAHQFEKLNPLMDELELVQKQIPSDHLLPLLLSENVWVRLYAAASLLKTNPAEAASTMRELSKLDHMVKLKSGLYLTNHVGRSYAS